MPTARELAFKTLKEVAGGVKLDDAVNGVLSPQSGLDARDERFYLQLAKTVLRNRSLLDYQIKRNSSRPLSKIDADILIILRMGILQLHLMDTAEYAALNETVELAKTVGSKWASGFVNGVMRSSLRKGMLYPGAKTDGPAAYLSILYSHPLWLVERWLGRFGYDDTEALLKANNTAAPTTALLRPGADTGSVDGGGLTPGPLGTYGIKLEARLRDFAPFASGELLIVDPSSTLGVAVLAPPPGATVGDFAAGVGGKTVQLAWRVGDEGKVIAVDNDARRMRVLASNLDKYELSNVSSVLADLTKGVSYGLDYILLDAPCSNSGVLRRKPDIRWRLRREGINKAASLQKKLLRSAYGSLNKGGLLVYETCSLEPEENENIIEWAVGNLEGAVVENAMRRLEPSLRESLGSGPFVKTYPHEHNCNGAFVAVLRRG